eukprot:scaffold30050_cov63-Phaeocystis_antarctica.AAC.3
MQRRAVPPVAQLHVGLLRRPRRRLRLGGGGAQQRTDGRHVAGACRGVQRGAPAAAAAATCSGGSPPGLSNVSGAEASSSKLTSAVCPRPHASCNAGGPRSLTAAPPRSLAEGRGATCHRRAGAVRDQEGGAVQQPAPRPGKAAHG